MEHVPFVIYLSLSLSLTQARTHTRTHKFVCNSLHMKISFLWLVMLVDCMLLFMVGVDR